MRVLALDTATEACSVALLVNGECISRFAELRRGHAEQILDMVDSVLAEAGIGLSGLDGIAASIGPGAFTGVRISVAVAQGLAFGAGLGVVPVTTLEALGLAAMSVSARALACLDARMGEVYWGCFERHATHGLIALSAPQVSPASSVKWLGSNETPIQQDDIHGIGRGFAAYPELTHLGLVLDPGAANALPNSQEIARLGVLRLNTGASLDPARLEPLYLRNQVALTEVERGIK